MGCWVRPKVIDRALWDFVSRVHKVYKTRHGTSDDESNDGNEDDGPHESVHVDVGTGRMALLADTKYRRPRCELTYPHLQHETHELRLKQPRKRSVPIPVGPAFLQRD